MCTHTHRATRPADAWLNQFATSPGAWRLLSRLLEAPNVQLNESFYAANSLRTVCLKHQVRGCLLVLAHLRPGCAVLGRPTSTTAATAGGTHACLPAPVLHAGSGSTLMHAALLYHSVCVCGMCTQDVLEVVTLGEFLPQLAYHLQTCLHRQHW
jgi:hypothetical protein